MKKPSTNGVKPPRSANESERDGIVTIVSRSPEETVELGRRIAHLVRPGDIIALTGELGTGKTCLTQGIGRGLGVPAEQFVRSASFVIANRYDGVYPIWHIDAYRLDNPADFVALGYEELIDSGSVAVIEWAEKAGELLPARAVRIALAHVAPTERQIQIDFRSIPADRKAEWKRALSVC
jgi:tRNA threonylcarbamoyladenosine biosynthesis protein TsaE